MLASMLTAAVFAAQADAPVPTPAPQGILHVTVVDHASRGPIVNASLKLGVEQTIDCDNAGICHDRVITGTYHVVVSAPGYIKEDARVIITEGTETDFDLRLMRANKKTQAPGKRTLAPKQPHTRVRGKKLKKAAK